MEKSSNLTDHVYRRAETRDRHRRNAIFYQDEDDEDVIYEDRTALQTGRRVENSYRKCYINTKETTKSYLNNNSNHDQSESKEYREGSPEGDAPIYPLNPPDDPKDPDQDCDPAERSRIFRSKCTDKSLPYVIAGYVVGLLMVLIWYYRHPEKACRDLNGKWVFIVLFFLLLIILVQRRPARCIAALCLASLASYQFRAVIIALAFLVACLGPVKNIIHNICIMANSASCGQNVLKQALRLMQRIIYDPSRSVEEAFQSTLSDARRLMDKLDRLLMSLEGPIAQIHATYNTCTSWLTLQRDHFDVKMGTPYNRCLKAGNLSISQCKSEFRKETKNCCNQQRFAWFCDSLKGVKSFFDDNLQWSQMIIEEIFQRLHLCFIKIRFIFITTISFDHTSKLNSSSSLTTNKDLVNDDQDIGKHFELQRRKFLIVFLWLDLIIFVLLLTVILQSLYFWFRYLAGDSFENIYITKDLENYDDDYYEVMGARALPLSSCEENEYVKLSSRRLLPREYSTICRSWMFLMITGIQLFCICYVDYSLYSMLTLMSSHGQMVSTDLQSSAYEKIVIKGGGIIGDILRDLVHAFEPKTFKINTQRCLPVPGKPKYLRYIWILLLYLLAWFMVFWEPYGLRQRHRIMVYFYPQNSKRRARKLHYIILKERKNLFKDRCQQARLLNAFENNNQLLICIPWLNSLLRWFGSPTYLCRCRGSVLCKCCTICKKPLTKYDNNPCDLPSCRGIYCNMCFQDCHNVCILCSVPFDTDIFELGNSSSESDADCSLGNTNTQQRDKKA
ncbi:DC-STAMP domain-containing protein 2 [Drosophila eugracilis]|uniref:DC-STAMP domain-containing protein 2 n=1 Tax=Drosophila eugracilis TaxID=29029 RepID=UPI001BD9CF6D|nr:DC-STAMP domain-containing protein 2 [Drosophila eugracilis]